MKGAEEDIGRRVVLTFVTATVLTFHPQLYVLANVNNFIADFYCEDKDHTEKPAC